MANFSSVRSGRGRSHRRGESRRTGQWKLAYADFLTALMAFFLLMWLATDTSMAERAAIAEYFGGGSSANAVTLDAPQLTIASLERRLSEALAGANLKTSGNHVRVDAIDHGLRIELTDTPQKSLFQSGDTTFNEEGIALMSALGGLIAQMQHPIRIEGHTDAFKTAPHSATNWSISTDRANAALELLGHAGVSPERFVAVSGLADTHPLLPTRPHAPANRRVSIVLELD